MNLMAALHIWRRRWILTILLLIFALAITAIATLKLPRHYQAESDVALLPSASLTVPNGHNPYLTYNGSLPTTAQMLSYLLTSPTAVHGLAAHGYSEPFTVTLPPNTAGAPILDVLVTGSNKAAVEATLRGGTGAISSELSSLQADIAPQNKIRVLPLTMAAHPSISISKTARPIVGVLILGLALALTIPLIGSKDIRRKVPDRVDRERRRAYQPAADSLHHLREYGARRHVPADQRPDAHGDRSSGLRAARSGELRVPD